MSETLIKVAAIAWTRHRNWRQRDQPDFEHFVECEALHQEDAMAPVVDAVLSAQAQGPADQGRPPVYFVGSWTRLGDELPAVGEPILLARWNAVDGAWRVRDAQIHVRSEGIAPSLTDVELGVVNLWWFDCIYPGQGDMRIPEPDMWWCRMPVPGWRP